MSLCLKFIVPLHIIYSVFEEMLTIKVVNKGHQPLPQYATSQSAGMDLRANLDEPVTLKVSARAFREVGLNRLFTTMTKRRIAHIVCQTGR